MTQGKTSTQNYGAGDVGVLVCFLVFGAVSGFLFAFLVSRPSLESFFFIKGDKFLIPHYSYWFTFSLLQLLGLADALVVCIYQQWVTVRIPPARLLAAALIVGLATPALRFVTPVMNIALELNWDIFVAPIVFLVLLSGALCILSGNVKLLPIAFAWNILFVAVAFGFIYVGVRIIGRSDGYEFVQWPVLEAMLALPFGKWLIWRQRAISPFADDATK